MLMQGCRLLSILPRRPREFYDRVATVVEVRADRRRPAAPDYPLRPWDEAAAEAARAFDAEAGRLLAEPELARIEQAVRDRLDEARRHSSIPGMHDGDIAFARLCYLACRLTQPQTVLETGVAHGVSTAFVLEALRVNGRGRLHSIDLPPLRGDSGRSVGAAVPDDLRERWELHVGATRLVLPALVKRIAPIGVFIHDSLHTYRTMRLEFQTVWPRLADDAVIIADDIEGNAAFAELIDAHLPRYSAAIAEADKRGSACGIGVWRRGGADKV